MTTMHYQLITFDLDDTLWHVAPVIERANRRTYHWLQQHCPALCERYNENDLLLLKEQILTQRPDLKHQISQLRIHTLRNALSEAGYTTLQANELAQQAFAVFIQARHEVEYFDYAQECLFELKQHYRLGVLTNGNACVKRLNLDHLFEFAFSAEQFNAGKPAPDLFQAALSYCQLTANQLIHVGDHPDHDIQAAQNLGIKTIWMNRKNEPWPGGRPADAEITSLRDLVSSVEWLEATAH